MNSLTEHKFPPCPLGLQDTPDLCSARACIVCAKDAEIVRLKLRLLAADFDCNIMDTKNAEIAQLRADFNDCNADRIRWRERADHLHKLLRGKETK